MTALKAKWSEMSLYRRVLLIVMAIEILAFFFATLVMINRPGLEYQDALLYPSAEGDIQIYQGAVDGETARFAVSPEWEVSYQWGDYTYGPYQITEDPAAVPDGYEGFVAAYHTSDKGVLGDFYVLQLPLRDEAVRSDDELYDLCIGPAHIFDEPDLVA